MAERPIKPRSPVDQIARKAAPTPADVARSGGRKTERYLLFSRRVVEFLVPNVGEFIDLRDRSVKKARSENGGEADESDFDQYFSRFGLRKLLLGMSRPVPRIFKAGFTIEAVRPKAQEMADAWAAEVNDERAARAKEAKTTFVPVGPDDVAARVEDLLADLALEAEDVDQMKSIAQVVPITDFDWDEPKSELNMMANAEMGDDAGFDFLALRDITAQILTRMTLVAMRGGIDRVGKLGAPTRKPTPRWR